MAVVNVNNLLNGKDSRWLQLEVCREFQRNKCTRPDTECKFAHPPTNVEVQNGRVTACYDSIKGRCNREKPPCKYFHPPQHLKDQLLINGRNHLALKNALLQQMGLAPGQPLIPSQIPTVDLTGKLQFPGTTTAAAAAATALALGQPQLGLMTSPYLHGVPQVGNTFNPYFNTAPIMPTTATILGPDPNNPLSMAVQQTVVTQQKMPRNDRLEPTTAGLAALTAAAEFGRKRPLDTNDDILMMDMKTVGAFYYENFAFPGMVPYKRAAGDKSGIPVYQQSAAAAAAYQQLLQPFVPVSCEYRLPTSTSTSTSVVGSTAFSSMAANAAAAFSTAGCIPPSSAAATLSNSAHAANAAAAAAAAAAFTGIALNKQTPSYSTAAAANTTSFTPRYQTTLNPAFAQHLLPTLNAALRPQYSTTVVPSTFSFAAANHNAAAAAGHFSDLFTAQLAASLTNSNFGTGMAASGIISSSGNPLIAAAAAVGNSAFNGGNNNNNNNINNSNNNNDEELQPFKKLKTN